MRVAYIVLTCEKYISTRVQWQLQTMFRHVDRSDLYFLGHTMDPDRRLFSWGAGDSYEELPSKFIDSQYISITEFKGGFFKRNTKGKLRFYEPRRTKIEIKHTNPYFENKNIDAFFYEKKRKFDAHSFLGGGVMGVSIGILLMGLL